MADFKGVVEFVGLAVDGAGVLVIAAGMLTAAARFVIPRFRTGVNAYAEFRHGLGRAILLGLEFLVAGDIIRTVVVAPTLQNVEVLGVIVLIRTFLSMSLEVELQGRWPWARLTGGDHERRKGAEPDQRGSATEAPATDPAAPARRLPRAGSP